MAPSVTLITGAGAGIGAAAARLFLESGSAVVLADLSEERLRSVEQTLGAGAAGLTVPTDVREFHSVQSLIDTGVERFGGFDTVLPNAGVTFIEKPFEEFGDSEIDQLLAANLKGVLS